MTATPQIQSEQGLGLVVQGNTTTPHERIDQGLALIAYNIPTNHMRATAGVTLLPLVSSGPMEITQAGALAVVRGRISQPNIRAFTFTLDGHDFYALRLGDAETLLYDLSSQEWVEWTSQDFIFWAVNCGINWIGAQKVGGKIGGSDVLVGDDTWGLLYFLSPTQPYDDHPDYLSSVQQLSYPRIVTAQITVPNRQNVPCYAIFLDTDNYGIKATDFVPYIQLETSDDQGLSWLNHGVQTTPQAGVGNGGGYNWYSLGQMASPGRLFRVTDNGIVARIDSLEMNDG